MIILTLRIRVTQDKREEVIKTFRSIYGSTTAETGCSECHIFQGIDEKNELCIMQEWKDETDLKSYILKNRFKIILALMEISCSPPVFKINTFVKSEGMDYIRSIKAQQRNTNRLLRGLLF